MTERRLDRSNEISVPDVLFVVLRTQAAHNTFQLSVSLRCEDGGGRRAVN
jgi:hypothetical protein